MPHLSCKPKQVCSPADMSGGECMPGLIWVSVTNTCFSQCWHPCFFPNCISTCPGFIGLWIFKDSSILHECKWLLVYQRQHCFFSQFNFTGISGSVNANAGTLNNVTVNENCTIKGMLEATQVRGDFVKAVSKSFPKQAGTWGNTETPNGTVTVTISDDHNFDRQIIIPPIIFNGIAYSDPGSGNNPGGTRYTGYGFEVRKNGVLIASRETKGAIPGSYSAVIDMPSGRGSVTLEFKVFHKGNQWAGNITDCTVIVTKKAASGISIR